MTNQDNKNETPRELTDDEKKDDADLANDQMGFENEQRVRRESTFFISDEPGDRPFARRTSTR